MDRWISVKNVARGLFPSERTVSLATEEGEISVFVSSNCIDEATNALKVELLDQDDKFALVQVPSQGGGTVAKVSREKVLSSPR